MSSHTTFNLNVSVRVILTEAGAERLSHLNSLVGRAPVKCGIVLTCELWRLFSDFGEIIAMGLPTPFKNNSIEIEPFDDTTPLISARFILTKERL